METQRGYNTTLPPSALDLKCAVMFAGHAFFVTRLASGIRIGGGVELGGLDIPPNFATPEVDPGKRGDAQVDLPKMVEGGLNAGFWIVYVGPAD